MKSKMLAKLLIIIFVLTQMMLIRADELGKDKESSFYDWYEQFPWMKEDFPFGTYGERVGSWVTGDKYFQSKLSLEAFSRNNNNYLWTTGISRKVNVKVDKTGHSQAYPNRFEPELSTFGKWYYGTNCRRNEMKSMPGLATWFRTQHSKQGQELFGEAVRMLPLMTQKEKSAVAEKLKGVFAYGRKLRKDYPDVVTAFISDDEPNLIAPAVGAYDLIEESIGAPAMTCNPTYSGVKMLSPYLKAITGDWYLTYEDSCRELWKMAPQLRWMRENRPDTVLWVMLWTDSSCLEGNEETLPDIPDSRGNRAELRMQIWQCVALGVKGLFAFQPNSGFGLMAASHGLFNCLFQKDPVNGHLDEWSSMGAILTTQGPLLLSCQLELDNPVKISCGDVRFPEFEGTAIDSGFLKDIKNDRLYLVPWNNDPLNGQTGKITFPDKLLENRRIYDLNTLKEVKLKAGNTLNITLKPGDGKIILIAPENEFAKCAQTILKKKTRTPRVILRQKLEMAERYGANLSAVNVILAKIKDAEAEREWEQALKLYSQATQAVETATQRIPKFQKVQKGFDEIVKILSETDSLFRSYLTTLGLIYNFQSHKVYTNEYVGDVATEWVELVRNYFVLLQEFHEDAEPRKIIAVSATLTKQLLLQRLAKFSLPALLKQAIQNQATLKKIIKERLDANRIPAKVAFVTANRTAVENNLIYSWLYKNANVRWFAPEKNNELVDRQGKRLDLNEFDVVWIHQLRYHRLPQDPKRPVVKNVLMPQIMKPDFVNAIKQFVKDEGKGLLLSGVAGLYSQPLGVESATPDLIQENGAMELKGVGVAPAPGYQKHPAFNGFEEFGLEKGFLTNGGRYSARFAWEAAKPSGKVIATMFDAIYGQMEEQAVMVEYPFGKGKIAVVDGLCLDMTPDKNHVIPEEKGYKRGRYPDSIRYNSRFGLRDRVRKFTLNLLDYLAKDKTFELDASAAKQLREKLMVAKEKRKNTVVLPLDGWKFKVDPDNVGDAQKWYASELNDQDWRSIKVGLNWEAQGVEYDGNAWYRIELPLKNRAGKKAFLRFEAVDEKATIYINGKKVGESHGEWNKPFEFDITSFLKDDSPCLLSVKVHDLMAAGGIWKPVSVIYNPKESPDTK